MENDKNILNEEALIKRVEEAARKGAEEGAKAGSKASAGAKVKAVGAGLSLLSKLAIPLMIAFLVFAVVPKLNPFNYLREAFNRESAVENHDMTMDNHGVFGFQVADFQEAVLGNSESRKKLEVYSVEVSDVSTVTEAGLGGFKIFSKNQMITYHGTAVYTVDMSKIGKRDIEYDDTTGVVTMTIPHAALETLEVPAENIEYSEVEKGKLAFGKIEMTPEESSEVQTAAVNKMKDKLKADNVAADADKMAVANIWSIYQPIISGVSPAIKLEVVVQ